MNLQFDLPEEVVDAIVERAAELVIAQLTLDAAADRAGDVAAYLTPRQAAIYLGCGPQRIYDLRSQRRLTPFTEGGRALVKREELDALVVVDNTIAQRRAA